MAQDWMNWTTDQVAEWSTSISLPHLVHSIYSLRITGEHLPKIDDGFLKTYLKVTSPAERLLFLQNLDLLTDMTAPHQTLPPVPQQTLTEEPPVVPRKRPPPKPNSIMDAQELINSPENLHSGWIIKQGGRIRSWKRRYMVLHQGCLYYFENEKSTKQKGSLALPGYVLSETNEVKEFPNCMKFAHKNPNKRVYLICTSSHREKEKWMESIQDELDLYKEENLLGQAIYGDGSDDAHSSQLNERLSDGDNDEESVNDFDSTPIPNLPSRFSKDKSSDFPFRSATSRPVASKADYPILHGNTMKPKYEGSNAPISSINSTPSIMHPSCLTVIVSHSSNPHLPVSTLPTHSPISSNPSSPISLDAPSILKLEPEMTEDNYLIISPSTPTNNTLTNGLAHRELPDIPDNKTLPPTRPLPTLPSELASKPIELTPTLENTLGKLHSSPGVHSTLLQNPITDVRQSLPNKLGDVKSYEDVEGFDDFAQLGANFDNTLKCLANPSVSPKTSFDTIQESVDEAAGVYISPNMEVLPGGCIQSSFTRIKAEEVLASINHDGMYLIRDSSEESINMVLTVWCKDRCKHYKVFKHEKGYCLHRGTYFTSLEELIRQYRVTFLPRSNFTLKTPFNLHSSNSRFS